MAIGPAFVQNACNEGQMAESRVCVGGYGGVCGRGGVYREVLEPSQKYFHPNMPTLIPLIDGRRMCAVAVAAGA